MEYEPETIVIPLTLTRVAVEPIAKTDLIRYVYKYEHPDAPGCSYIVEARVPEDQANEDTIACLFAKCLEYDVLDLADTRREMIINGGSAKTIELPDPDWDDPTS